LPGNASRRNYAYISIFYNTHPLTLSGDRAKLSCRQPPMLFEMLVLAELPRCSLARNSLVECRKKSVPLCARRK